jgi:hypothetical protein
MDTARDSRTQATVERQQFLNQNEPILFLSCFKSDADAPGSPVPHLVYFISVANPPALASYDPKKPTISNRGQLLKVSEFYGCTLTNYGETAAISIRLPFTVLTPGEN